MHTSRQHTPQQGIQSQRIVLGIKVVALALLLITHCIRWDGWAWLELIHLSAFLVGVLVPLILAVFFFKKERRIGISISLSVWAILSLLVLIFAIDVAHRMGLVGLTFYFYPGPHIYHTVIFASFIMLEIVGYITGSRPLKD